jgi:hypothetical protein
LEEHGKEHAWQNSWGLTTRRCVFVGGGEGELYWERGGDAGGGYIENAWQNHVCPYATTLLSEVTPQQQTMLLPCPVCGRISSLGVMIMTHYEKPSVATGTASNCQFSCPCLLEEQRLHMLLPCPMCAAHSLGVMIMTHGDDKGLVLPPRVAPKQVCMCTGMMYSKGVWSLCNNNKTYGMPAH